MNDSIDPIAERHTLRTLVRGTYDLQKIRVGIGNRIVANFKAKLGQEPSAKEETIEDDQSLELLSLLRASYKRLTDGVVGIPPLRKFRGDNLISTYTELCLMHEYEAILDVEERHFRRLPAILTAFPIYTQFLKGVPGCGPAMSGVIISEFDITKAKYVSSLWAYAGLDVGPDGRGRSRRKEHLVTRSYINSKGEPAERQSITFNPFLKTKLMGVLGPSFLRSNSPYREFYDNYRHRLDNHPEWQERRKAWRRDASIRYMVKMFLADLYEAWRPLAGLAVHHPYAEAKLGIVHSSDRAA